MSETPQRIDGRHIATKAAETLEGIIKEMSGLAGLVDAQRIPVWQEKLQTMVNDTPTVMERLFLKTQGGTHMAQVGLEKVEALATLLSSGLKGMPAAQATEAVDAAVAAVEADFGGVILKAKTHIIRMT